MDLLSRSFNFWILLLSQKNFKDFLKFEVYVCGVCVNAGVCGARGVRSDTRALELQVSVSHLTWVPGIELGSSARAVCALSRWAVSHPAHPNLLIIYYKVQATWLVFPSAFLIFTFIIGVQ